MSKLETAQEIWEKSAEIFANIDEKKKRDGFNNLIDEIEECSVINTLQNQRNSLTEEQKLKIYKRHSISVGTRLRYTNMSTFGIGEKIYHWIKNYKKEWKENALKYATLEEIPCRFLIQLGILDKPQWLTNDKLKEDVKKDAKNFNIYLWLCEAICAVIPGAQEIIPFIAIAQTFTIRYQNHWTEIIIDRLNKHKKLNIKDQTSEDLLTTMKTEKHSKKAA